MQLDKTQIAIRSRTILENYDLTFSVIREYFGAILFWSFVGIAPFALLNHLVLARQLQFDDILLSAGYYQTEVGLTTRYAFNAFLLVFLEAPLALLPVTYYVGQSVFTEKPKATAVFAALKRTWWRAVLVLGLLRGGLLGLVALAFVPMQSGYSAVPEFVFAVLMVGVPAVLIRAIRPFVPEILILEECRLSKSSEDQVTVRLRSSWLHGVLTGEMIGQMFLTGIFGAGALIALAYSTLCIRGVLIGTWEWDWFQSAVLFPASLWIIAVSMTVFRFLTYVDSRIRLEGWEVELRFRAEAEKLEAVS